MSTKATTIAPMELAVRRMYEAFPYPHYPLIGKPRWQDGYLASSKFAGRLFEDLLGREAAINGPVGPFLRHPRTILVAGAGEALPYVLRKIEPRQHRLLCVDLSRRSLRRARFRLGPLPYRTDLVHADINTYLRQQASVTGPFNHIDAYGVLHHLPNPSETLRSLANHLSSNGTIRIMVYNSSARHWIHEIQTAFRLMKLDPYRSADRDFARTLLRSLCAHSPALKFKIDCLGKKTLQNDARLVDTFFHVREARLSISRWFEVIDEARLVPFALVDRYGELDDLPNPLWQMPSQTELVERSLDRRYENNFEVYLRKKFLQESPARRIWVDTSSNRWDFIRQFIKQPPSMWFSFPETAGIKRLDRQRLWYYYLRHVSNTSTEPADRFIKTLPEPAIARLCRVGAILPRQIKDPGLVQIGMAAMEVASEAPQSRDMANFDALPIKGMIESKLANIHHRRPKRLALILEHFKRAQIDNMDTYRKYR